MPQMPAQIVQLPSTISTAPAAASGIQQLAAALQRLIQPGQQQQPDAQPPGTPPSVPAVANPLDPDPAAQSRLREEQRLEILQRLLAAQGRGQTPTTIQLPGK